MLDSLTTIIIPMFNAASTIERCLRAASAQSHTNIEIIVIDDGSTDGSDKIVTNYSKTDSRVNMIRQENHGAGIARNAGLKQARGTYIAFSDADDTMDKDMISILLDGLCSVQSNWSICSYRTHRISENGTTILSDLRLGISGKYNAIELFKGFTQGDPDALGKFSSQCNKLYRKSIIDQYDISFPSTRLYEDLHFNLSYMEAAPLACLIDIPLFTYYRHNNNATIHYRPHGFEETEWLYDLVRNILRYDTLSKKEQSMLERHYIDKVIIIMRLLCRDNSTFSQQEVLHKIQSIVAHPHVRDSLKICMSSRGSQDEALLEMMRNYDHNRLYETLRKEFTPHTRSPQ